MQVPLLPIDWPVPPGVHAVFTTRGRSADDGASLGPHARFNLGEHVDDDPRAVAVNRARLRRAIGARPVFLNQVHGAQVAVLRGDTSDGVSADAALTDERALACTIMVADCLPILLTDAAGRRVAAVHVGWRGLAAGVIERVLQHFLAPTLADRAEGAIEIKARDLLAWLGPCIGPRAFEVGGDVLEACAALDGGAPACFEPLGGGKYLADLPGLARRRLVAGGVSRLHGNAGDASWCTVANEGQYFSHRRDQRRLGGSGRMAACIWRA